MSGTIGAAPSRAYLRSSASLTVAVQPHQLGDLGQRCDPLRLDQRLVGWDTPPRQDLRVGACLMHQPRNERAMTGDAVEGAVEHPTDVAVELRVGGRVGESDGVTAQLHVGPHDAPVEPVVRVAPGVEDRHHRTAALDRAVRVA